MDVKTNCGFCEKEIPDPSGPQVGHAAAGRRIFCSLACRRAFANANYGKSLQGPCPTCGRMFTARSRGKKFCSIGCYTTSPDFRARMQGYNEARKIPRGRCLKCGEVCKRPRMKLCGIACTRQYYAERFDRWVANPERIALPQCYDEFLCQDELPCLVEGCEWVGKHLGSHANRVHGITADQLKELAGFNLKTGLVSSDLRESMAEKARRMLAAGILVVGAGDLDEARPMAAKRTYKSLEGREHHAKAMAISKAVGEPKPPVPCLQCGKPTEQPLTGMRRYCSLACRAEFYKAKGMAELSCTFCGQPFTANRTQVLRAQRGLKVCCSEICRNRMNMVACLASRGIEWHA